jgi:tetratricopeptide (TPR) repeat protein
LARYYSITKNAEMLLRVSAPELCGVPPAEICCALADYYLAKKNFALAAEWYEAASSGAEIELAAEYAGAYPYMQLAACYAALGDTALSQEYREKAADWKPETLIDRHEEDLRHLSL